MKVKDLMVKAPAVCSFGTNLGAAVELLWSTNCGFLPVVDTERKVTGVVTDRDIAIALGTRNRLPGEIVVADVATRKVHSCKATDDVRNALDTMAEQKVRRLIVVNEQNQLEGVLSMDDIVIHAETQASGKPDLPAGDILRTLKMVYSPQLAARVAKA